MMSSTNWLIEYPVALHFFHSIVLSSTQMNCISQRLNFQNNCSTLMLLSSQNNRSLIFLTPKCPI